ncbi:cytochrome P450 [Bradyrhizobium viridifuturi]|jgi:cytochrome P450|nr:MULTISPECIES: cytochrome P450 [Bradyrhizobium]ERF80598.1 MAG: branched-chain amino acid transport system substrate-binding protein [Bradyrhizobium sp. DFCI-1]OYU58657.1 MAG: cytochrome P450 [Bradyrhizobium sp. PARBB1]PSO24524.1 cytochrome P450 [Bradyrhizobium sp. MOS004]QRI71501.1 cytochrome P450 [Bradyrhizobium sp. PSBB068]MBR1019806.1 cytochrome P450 [Bradyrhizobium viridifuturi]
MGEALRRPTSTDVSNPWLYQDDTWRPLFAQLRRDDPVHYCETSAYGPYWSVTRYDDIFAVELDHQNYSSASELGGIQVADQPKGQERPSFIRMDPPGHTAQRRTVAPIVAPSNLANLEALIRQRTATVLDALPRNETFDWAERVSVDLTNMMLATLFDFPAEDRAKLTWWSDVAIANIDSPDAVVHSEAERNAELIKMGEAFRKLWDARIDAPPTFDLISMLAHSEATRNLDAREFIGTIGLLIVGGNDTTRNSMSAGLMALCENPEQFELVRARRELIPNLVSETIRYHTPVLHMRRTARNDVELAGRQIKKGDKVVMWYISGNRDEDKIERADEFIIDRAKPRQHLAFGAGVHRCVGDRLAEQQLRILWEEVLARDLRFEIMGPPQRLYSNFIRGIRSLPVRIVN